MGPSTNDHLTVSVVIPCHNGVATIQTVVTALAHQSVPQTSLEIVVVDDGSTDGSGEVLRTLRSAASNGPSIVLEEMGPRQESCSARVRNRGLARAGGHIVIFLDADVLVGPDFVAEHVKSHCASNADTAVIGYIFAHGLTARARLPEVLRPPPVHEVLDRLPELLREDRKRWNDGREATYRIWPDLVGCPVPWTAFWSGNVSLRRDFVTSLGGFDGTFKDWGWEDLELGYRIWKQGASFRVNRQAWGFHYPHPCGGDERALKNMHQFLAKHREPYAEVGCFSVASVGQPGASRARWEALDLIGAPPVLATPTPDTCVAALDLAKSYTPGAIAWFGSWPANVPTLCRPEMISRPFEHEAAGGESALIGLAVPVPPLAFGAAIAFEYWRQVPPVTLRFICSELTRIAHVCILTTTDPMAEIGDLSKDFVVDAVSSQGLHARVVRRRGV